MKSLNREGVATGLNTGRHVLLRGVSRHLVSPFDSFDLQTDYYIGPANLVVVPVPPVERVDVLLG